MEGGYSEREKEGRREEGRERGWKWEEREGMEGWKRERGRDPSFNHWLALVLALALAAAVGPEGGAQWVFFC